MTASIAKGGLAAYGYMATTFARSVESPNRIPESFSQGDPNRRQSWSVFVEKVVLSLERIGPRYGRPSWQLAWTGISRLDLSVMETLVKSSVLLHDVTNGRPIWQTHADAFAMEDQADISGTITSYIRRALTPWESQQIDTLKNVGLVEYLGTIHLELKPIFQRPRPHVAAYVLGLDASHLIFGLAKTGWSPAFVSGHACVFGIAYLFLHQQLQPLNPARDMLDACRQLIVDGGDRRVFAGVHYPSDNLGSWLVIANLINECWATENREAAKQLFVDSLRNSRVYREIRSESQFDAAFKHLDELLAPTS
jgi:PAP2 superfamily